MNYASAFPGTALAGGWRGGGEQGCGPGVMAGHSTGCWDAQERPSRRFTLSFLSLLLLRIFWSPSDGSQMCSSCFCLAERCLPRTPGGCTRVSVTPPQPRSPRRAHALAPLPLSMQGAAGRAARTSTPKRPGTSAGTRAHMPFPSSALHMLLHALGAGITPVHSCAHAHAHWVCKCTPVPWVCTPSVPVWVVQ